MKMHHLAEQVGPFTRSAHDAQNLPPLSYSGRVWNSVEIKT
jgi:hypothetical protein